MTVLKVYQKSTPSTYIEINQSHPSALGIVAVQTPHKIIGPFTQTNGTFPLVPSTNGISQSFNGTNQYYNSSTAVVTGFPFTVLVLGTPATTTGARALFCISASATHYHELYFSGTSISLISSDSGASAATATSAISIGKPGVFVGRVSSATERSVWIDGVQRATNAVSRSPSAATALQFFTFRGTSEFFSGTSSLSILWNRALSDVEIATIGNDPWKLFNTVSKRIPISVASSGAYTLTASQGTYTYIGQDSTILRSKVLTANSGSYTISGQSTTILKSKKLSAAFGTYSYNGQDATITYTSGGTNYTLAANYGAYTVTGQSTTLFRNKVVSASHGTYSLAGQAATVAYSGSNTITLKAGSWLRYRIIQ